MLVVQVSCEGNSVPKSGTKCGMRAGIVTRQAPPMPDDSGPGPGNCANNSPAPPCAHAPARPEIKLGKTSQSQSWCYPSRAYRDTPPESLIPRDEVKHKMVSEY